MTNKRITIGIIILLILFSLPAILSLFHPGFFVTDDGEWMIIRLSAFYAALRDGQFPVRFLERLNFSYGYPVSEFLYPGILYAGSLLHVFKVGFVDSIKIIMGISLVGSTVFTYFWLSKLFSKTASFIGALFAIYLPYHLYDAYTRGSIGELFALFWVPFILWMIERKNIYCISIGIFFLILSHNSLSVLFLPLLFFYALLRKGLSLKIVGLSFGLGILLASFFIIPVLFELHYTVFSQTTISNPLGYFSEIQLIGYAAIIILLGAVIKIFITKHYNKKYKSLALFFFCISILTIIFSTAISSPIWSVIPANFIQFPFRLLSYLLISIAFLAAFYVDTFKRKSHWIAAVILSLLLIFFALPFSSPKSFFDKGEGYYFTNEATTTVLDEYMPVWVKEKPLKRPEKKVEIIKGNGELQNIITNNKKISFTANISNNALVKINTIYWPGWKGTIDGKDAQIQFNNPKGLMTMTIPPGKHTVHFSFGETPVRMVGDALSLLALLLILFTFKKRLNKKS